MGAFKDKFDELKIIIGDGSIIDISLGKEEYRRLIAGNANNVAQRKADNDKALSIVNNLKGEDRHPTREEIEALKKYTGNGGLGTSGSTDEYYTPEYVIDGTWDMLGDLDGGNILDPSSGIGKFADARPSGIEMTNVEYSELSAFIASTTEPLTVHSSFEEHSYNIPDGSLDGVITNAPFGKRDISLDKSPRFNKVTTLEGYFIARSLELVKSGKRVVMLVPSGFIESTKTNKAAKELIIQKGAFLGGVRLPNKVFAETGANVSVDILVFEKHPKEIYEALQSNGLAPLSVSKLYEESKLFINGGYFDAHKENVIGEVVKIDSEHPLFNGNNYGISTLTPLTMEEVEEEVARKTATEFKNTINYSSFEFMDSMSNEDRSRAIEQLERLKDASMTINEDEKAFSSIKKMNDYIKVVNPIVKDENNQIFRVMKKHDYLIHSMANYLDTHKYSLSLKPKDMATILSDIMKIAKHKKELQLQKESSTLAFQLLADNNFKKYYDKAISIDADTEFRKLYRDNCKEAYTMLHNSIKALDEVSMTSGARRSLHEIKRDLPDSAISTDEQGNIILDNTDGHITAEELRANPTLWISEDGIVSRGQISNSSTSVKDARLFIDTLEYSSKMGISEDDFKEKKESMTKEIELLIQEIDIKNVLVTDANAHMLLPKVSHPQLTLIKQTLLRGLNIYFADTKGNMNIENAEDTVKIGFGYVQVGKSGSRLSSFLQMYFDEVKEAVKGTQFEKSFLRDASEAYRWMDAYFDKHSAEQFTNLIRNIAHTHNVKQLAEYNIKLDLAVKSDPLLSSLLSENINKHIKLQKSNSYDASIDYLKGYVTQSILDTNHDYQNKDIDEFSDSMNGIAGHDTGLGKTRIITLTALASIAKGKAKRVLIVVPTGIQDNWKLQIFGNDSITPIVDKSKHDEVMFITSKNKEDWNNLRNDTKTRVIVIGSSMFSTIMFEDESVKYLRGDTQKDIDAKNGQDINYSKIPRFHAKDWNTLTKPQTSTVGYFDGTGIDMVIVDESQDAKNSATGGKNVKFASAIKGSRYGIVLSAISTLLYAIQGEGRGTILASATPFSSTPYEIFTVLKNAGGLKGIDTFEDFTDEFVTINKRYIESTIKKELVEVETFDGLHNLPLLRANGLDNIAVRTMETESTRNPNLKSLKPEKNESIVTVKEDEETTALKEELIKSFELCRNYVKAMEQGDDSGLRRYGEDLEALGYDLGDYYTIEKDGSPFSILNKIKNLAISKEFAKREIEFDLSGVKDIEKFKTELLKRSMKIPTIETVQQKDGSFIEKEKTVSIKLSEINEDGNLFDGDTLKISPIDEALIGWIMGKLKDSNILDITKYPKYEAVINNIVKNIEKDKNTKELIFSLSLSGARVFEYLLRERLNELKIKAKIMNSINAHKDKKAEFQEEYNNSNGLTFLIFTEAYSKGVNFNINTKHVHLMDIPYVPNTWHQAEGRGVRQGNVTKVVGVTKYMQDGSLDSSIERILDEKNDWQEEVMSMSDSNSITTTGVNIEAVIAEAINEYGGGVSEEQIKSVYDRKKEAFSNIQIEEKKHFDKTISSAFRNACYVDAMDKDNILKNEGSRIDQHATNFAQLEKLEDYLTDKQLIENINKANTIVDRIVKLALFRTNLNKPFAWSFIVLEATYINGRPEEYLDKVSDLYKSAKNGKRKDEGFVDFIDSKIEEAKGVFDAIISKADNKREVLIATANKVVESSDNAEDIETAKGVLDGSIIFTGNYDNPNRFTKISDMVRVYNVGDDTLRTKFIVNGTDVYLDNDHGTYENVKGETYQDKDYYTYKNAIAKYEADIKKQKLLEENTELKEYFTHMPYDNDSYNGGIKDYGKLIEIANIVDDIEIKEDINNILALDDFIVKPNGRDGILAKKGDTVIHSRYVGFDSLINYIDATEEFEIDFHTYKVFYRGGSSLRDLISLSPTQLAIYDRAIELGYDVNEFVLDSAVFSLPIQEMKAHIVEWEKAEKLRLSREGGKQDMTPLKELLATYGAMNSDEQTKMREDIYNGMYYAFRGYIALRDNNANKEWLKTFTDSPEVNLNSDLTIRLEGAMFQTSKKPKGNINGFRYNSKKKNWTIQADSEILKEMADALME
jgi:hypothetical protein